MNCHSHRPQYGIPENIVRRKRKPFPVKTGPIIFEFNSDSFTKGKVLSYNDNIINLPEIDIQNQFPILTACKFILKAMGRTAATYKFQLMQNNKLIYIIRSILWGTKRTWDENQPDWLLIDHPMEQRFQG